MGDDKDKVQATDAAIRARGDQVFAVRSAVKTATNWSDNVGVSDAPCGKHALPLAGFSVNEAEMVDKVIRLVAKTPFARAEGYVEIRAIRDIGGG